MIDGAKIIRRISEMRTEGYLADAMLREAVKHIKAGDQRYNFVGVYMLDAADNTLWLHNYLGEPTDHARIPVGRGVCGTAVAENRNQNVPDVTQVGNYLSCSPRTKSELVVLIHADGQIVGQIDIDAREVNAFSKDDQENIELVAQKLGEMIERERRDMELERQLEQQRKQPQQPAEV
ncbi:MAG TPA: GAF domain-containing protein [Longimicrobiales bacterium]